MGKVRKLQRFSILFGGVGERTGMLGEGDGDVRGSVWLWLC